MEGKEVVHFTVLLEFWVIGEGDEGMMRVCLFLSLFLVASLGFVRGNGHYFVRGNGHYIFKFSFVFSFSTE